MILADTSVWVDHFRHGNKTLTQYLESSNICIHPFVIGELACGNLQSRQYVLAHLDTLYRIDTVTDQEAIAFIDFYQLFAKGIGYVDVHLLAASKLSGVMLWTLDKRLKSAAKTIGLS